MVSFCWLIRTTPLVFGLKKAHSCFSFLLPHPIFRTKSVQILTAKPNNCPLQLCFGCICVLHFKLGSLTSLEALRFPSKSSAHLGINLKAINICRNCRNKYAVNTTSNFLSNLVLTHPVCHGYASLHPNCCHFYFFATSTPSTAVLSSLHIEFFPFSPKGGTIAKLATVRGHSPQTLVQLDSTLIKKMLLVKILVLVFYWGIKLVWSC